MYVGLHYTTYPDNKDPLNKRQTKARNGPISSCSWSSQTERQEKSNPVEEECHWESRTKAAGQALFIFQGEKTPTIKPLHTGFSWCKHKCENNSSHFGSLPEKKLSSTMYLLKNVSMKMPSFPILSWSVSSKSSRVTKSSSWKPKGDKMGGGFKSVQSTQQSQFCIGSSRAGQQIV